jgi:hypothetical protein
MKGDFSRDTFNFKKNFRRVLMEQGRVQLDADWNEQSSILLHYIQTLAADLIGPHAGPGDGFALKIVKNTNGTFKDLTIEAGHYYVDGILCENAEKVSFFEQPHVFFPDDEDKTIDLSAPFFAYLDVWERHVTSLEDESIADVALGGIPTASRSQVVWQVKLREVSQNITRCANFEPPAPGNALLIADVPESDEFDDPCNIAPDSRYRGAENQLYRVEIHTGNVEEFGGVDNTVTPTFKWSRENGSAIFPVISITVGGDTTEVRLAHLGRDDKFGLREGDWVEIVDDGYTLGNRPAKLLKVTVIDRDETSVTLKGATAIAATATSKNHALLRRWDQKPGNSEDRDLTLGDDNAAEIVEGTGDNNWLTLEDGIQIQFVKTTGENSTYRTGDYWLIPARTATGDIIWEQDENGIPQPQLSHGVKHHYAPLGLFINGVLNNCRCNLESISSDCTRRRLGIMQPQGRVIVDGNIEPIKTEKLKASAPKTKAATTKDKNAPK